MKQGWEIKKLGDVCKVIAGQSPEGKFYNNDMKGLPFYQGKKEFAEKFIGEPTTWTTKITKEAEADDILMSVRAPVGPVNFSTQKICIGRGLAAIRVGNLIDKEFLFNYLLNLENEIIGNTGAVFNSINKTQIEEISIPLPPLPEQQRIVAILDEAFAAIAKAKANAEQNLKNAKELFDSYLQSVFAGKASELGFEGLKDDRIKDKTKSVNTDTDKNKIQKIFKSFNPINHNSDNDEIWEEKTLGEVADTWGRIGWKGLTAKEYKSEGPLFISVHSLNYGDYVDFRDAFHISQERYDESPEIMLKKDDILICKDGAGIGKLGIIPKLTEQATINSSLLLIRCNKNVKTKFLYYYLRSPHFQSIVKSRLMGSTTPHLYQRDIVTFPILIPMISEQSKIVNILDSLSIKCKDLDAIYQKKIEDLDELKKSILQKAFSGGLN